jgi:DNA-directed RNA polymerase specialized sigma subunit
VPVKNNRWAEELYLYRIKPAPPKKNDFQEYIALYCAEKDEKYLKWFLHYFEPRINTVIMQTVQETAMQGHFVDLKQAYIFGICKALQKYDISTGVPFLIFKEFYVKNETDNYIRTMRHGYSVQSLDEYRTLKKAMALYAKYEFNFDAEAITKIAAEIGKSVKDTKEIILTGIDSTHYTDFYRRYADEDGESTAEDATIDHSMNPERLFFQEWQADALFDAYENLDYRERTMVADHLGFCTECYGIYELSKDENGTPIKFLRKEKAYIDLAAGHMLSSPDSAFRIVNGAYEKMRKELTDKGIF